MAAAPRLRPLPSRTRSPAGSPAATPRASGAASGSSRLTRAVERRDGAPIALHGPAGIGKSALLRELSRRAGPRGFEVIHVDAADPPDGPAPVTKGRRRPPGRASHAAVRDALRNFHDDVALAESPRARGSGRPARAESVRGLVRCALERGFGSAPHEQDLRRTVEAAYLHRRASHERTADALSLSRWAYFSRLRHALERIVPYVADEVGA